MAEGPDFAATPLDTEEALRISIEVLEMERDGFRFERVVQSADETLVTFSRPRPWPTKDEQSEGENAPPKPQALPPSNSTTRKRRQGGAASSAGNCDNHPECATSTEHQVGPHCRCVYEGCPGGTVIVEPCS